MDHMSPIVEPFQGAFEQARERFNAVSWITPGRTSLGAGVVPALASMAPVAAVR